MTDQVDDNDKQLFRQAVQGVKPLKPADKTVIKKEDKPTNRPLLRQKAQQQAPTLKTKLSLQTKVSADALLSYRQTGLSPRQWQLLRQGLLPIEASLDLHGFTVDQALIALEHFFDSCQQQEMRVLRIIHGKGRYQESIAGPKIKNVVFNFLQAREEVLAFHSAPAAAGGNGAVLVLLKR